MSSEIDDRPLIVKIPAWFGYIFSGIFMLYGGVKVILSIMDRAYDQISNPIIFLVLGLITLAPVIAYSEKKVWGYYGLIVVNGLIILGAAYGYAAYENIIILIIAGTAEAALLSPRTKKYLFSEA